MAQNGTDYMALGLGKRDRQICSPESEPPSQHAGIAPKKLKDHESSIYINSEVLYVCIFHVLAVMHAVPHFRLQVVPAGHQAVSGPSSQCTSANPRICFSLCL